MLNIVPLVNLSHRGHVVQMESEKKKREMRLEKERELRERERRRENEREQDVERYLKVFSAFSLRLLQSGPFMYLLIKY